MNQDAVMCRILGSGDGCCALAMVCDGIGGLEHGEIASGLLIRKASNWVSRLEGWLDPAAADPEVLFSHLRDAAEEWNGELLDYFAGEKLSSGTTMSALMLVRERFCIVHVGDSKVYRIRREGLPEQISTDDSVSILRDGRVKKYLNNYMGMQPELRFQSIEGRLEHGDLFLVCSDGFCHHLEQEDVRKIGRSFRRGKGQDEACMNVIRSLMERGERDNISVAVLQAD